MTAENLLKKANYVFTNTINTVAEDYALTLAEIDTLYGVAIKKYGGKDGKDLPKFQDLVSEHFNFVPEESEDPPF